MTWLNGYRMRLVVVGCVAAILLGSGSAKADFTFGEATNLGPRVNSSAPENQPNISADGLRLYFQSNRLGGQGGNDLWVTSRATKDDPWGPPANLGPAVNSSGGDGYPCILADGLTLYFQSNRSEGHGRSDIWVTTRATVNNPWGPPVNLGPPLNTADRDAGPSIPLDGLSLYFNSDRPGGFGRSASSDLWVSNRATTDDAWGEPVNLGPSVNSPDNDLHLGVSADGMALFFTSSRPGGSGPYDIWVSTWSMIDTTWDLPVNLGPIVNSPASDRQPSISNDGSTLYFSSDRSGGEGDFDIWKAPIIPIVDLNGDGIVDAADMCIIVDHWGTDEPLCDIGPMPWGDGIVDVQDLIVLAEHLFEEFPPVE
jgi:Tol biopolymer transport system component